MRPFSRADVGEIGGPALRLDEQGVEREAEQDAQTAEDDERPTPAVLLPDGAGEEAARDRSGIDAGLMQAHGAGARGFSVVIADHRHGGREVAGLAQSLGCAEEEEVAEIAGQRRGYADQAPEMETGENRGFSAHPVDDRAGERRPQAIDPGEGRTEKPELHGRKPHFLLEQGEDRKDGLAVGVIEERDPPQHGDEIPLVYVSSPGEISRWTFGVPPLRAVTHVAFLSRFSG